MRTRKDVKPGMIVAKNNGWIVPCDGDMKPVGVMGIDGTIFTGNAFTKPLKTGRLQGVCNCQCHCGLDSCFTNHDKSCEHCEVKKVGKLHGVPVYSDPKAPSGYLFGFNKLECDGHEVHTNDPATVLDIELGHIFKTKGFNLSQARHSCLREGYWCWKNFFEHPLDIIKYIKRKLWKLQHS